MRSGTWIFFALLISIIIALLYVHDKARKEEKVEGKEIILNLWNIPQAGSPSVVDQANRAVFDSFIEKYPQYGARSVTGIKLIGPAQESNFLLAMAGNTAPDLYESNFRSITTFIQQNFCFPMEYIPDFVRWKEEIHHWEDPLNGKKYYSKELIERLQPEERERILKNPINNYDFFYLPQIRPILCREVFEKNQKTGQTEKKTLT